MSANLRCGMVCVLSLVLFCAGPASAGEGSDTGRIRPYRGNPRYWQYRGNPVMLLGGSKTDHIFLLEDLEAHLDEMLAVGANYVRNTMSQREGAELKPHRLLENGKFNLEEWNDEYWLRFQNMLKWTSDREIFVQIEVWDRFDFSKEQWESSPWNPANNVNYTGAQTSLASKYPRNPWHDMQPFFHSIEGMPRYNPKLDLVRSHQEAFVARMLSFSIDYGHVIYCMNNETSTPARWGQYWIEFIKSRADEKGVSVCTTDMFDDAFDASRSKHTPVVFDDPEHYVFADISQVNSRCYDETHWEHLRWLLGQINAHPRPVNHTKIYGNGYHTFGTGGPEDGVERFWRNILGGSASARFHRPDGGNGLNDFAKGSIKAARVLESRIKFWDISPHMELLSGRESNEAYLAAKPGECYALYFTDGGSVELDLSVAAGTLDVTWISVSTGATTRTRAGRGWRLMKKKTRGSRKMEFSAPYKGGWIAAIVRE